MRKSYLFLLVLLLLSACADSSPLTANEVGGTIAGRPDQWKGRSLYVYAAYFYGEADSGYFVLEPDLYPHAQVSRRGDFRLSQMPDERYILLAGPSPDEALRLMGAGGHYLMLRPDAERGIDLGEVFVEE